MNICGVCNIHISSMTSFFGHLVEEKHEVCQHVCQMCNMKLPRRVTAKIHRETKKHKEALKSNNHNVLHSESHVLHSQCKHTSQDFIPKEEFSARNTNDKHSSFLTVSVYPMTDMQDTLEPMNQFDLDFDCSPIQPKLENAVFTDYTAPALQMSTIIHDEEDASSKAYPDEKRKSDSKGKKDDCKKEIFEPKNKFDYSTIKPKLENAPIMDYPMLDPVFPMATMTHDEDNATAERYPQDKKRNHKCHIKEKCQEELFACDQCSYKSKWQHNIQRHMKVHQRREGEKCQKCRKSFLYLDSHMENCKGNDNLSENAKIRKYYEDNVRGTDEELFKISMDEASVIYNYIHVTESKMRFEEKQKEEEYLKEGLLQEDEIIFKKDKPQVGVYERYMMMNETSLLDISLESEISKGKEIFKIFSDDDENELEENTIIHKNLNYSDVVSLGPSPEGGYRWLTNFVLEWKLTQIRVAEVHIVNINACSMMLTRETERLELMKIEVQLAMEEREIVIFPLIGKRHFSCVIVWLEGNVWKYSHLDSLEIAGYHREFPNVIMEKIFDEKYLQYQKIQVLQQNDGENCGLFTIENIYRCTENLVNLCNGDYNFLLDSFDPILLRKEIFAEIQEIYKSRSGKTLPELI